MVHRRLRVWGSLALALLLGAPLGAVGHAAVLFQDDFSGTLGAWTTDGSGISGSIVGGALQVTGSGDGFFRTIQTFSPTPGYTLEFDVVSVGATSFVSPCVGVTGFNSPGQGYLIDGNMTTGMDNLYHRLNSAWTLRQGSAMRSNPASGDRVAVTVVPNGANFDVYFWRNSCLNALTQAPAANPVITGGVGIRMTNNRSITVDNFVVTDTLPDPNIAPPGYLFRDDFSNPLRYGWYYQGATAGIQTNPSGQLVLDARAANDGWMLTRTAFNPASTYTVSFDIAQLLMAPGDERLGVILGGGNFAAAGSNGYLFDFRTEEEEVRIFLRSGNAWTGPVATYSLLDRIVSGDHLDIILSDAGTDIEVYRNGSVLLPPTPLSFTVPTGGAGYRLYGDRDFIVDNFSVVLGAYVFQEIPEPGTLALLGAGLIALARRRRPGRSHTSRPA